MKRVVIYSRVSTNEQTSENQTQFLNQVIEQNGWNLIDTYVDEGISGSKGRDKRPQFDRLCKDMVRRKFDMILVWDVSRLGRSLSHLVEFLNDLQSVDCDLFIYQQGLDTSTPTGKMMFQMVGVFSEFERSMISERVKLGLQRVKNSGKKLGRRSVVSDDLTRQILDLHNEGLGLKAITERVNVGRTSVYQIIKANRKISQELRA